MKTIQPVNIWQNGQIIQAKILNSYAINDNLSSSATFWYGLYSETNDGYIGNQVAQGNLVMTGADYLAWTQNQYAWDWVASTLNLTITGDYIPPVPPTPDTSGTSGSSGTSGTSGTSGKSGI
jgi:hypothetical protein